MSTKIHNSNNILYGQCTRHINFRQVFGGVR